MVTEQNVMVDEIVERKQRWMALQEKASGPGFVFLVGTQEQLVTMPEHPKLWPQFKQDRVEAAWKSYQNQMAICERVKDDRIPALHIGTGTEIFAEAFGCDVHRPDDMMPFALPMIHSAEEVANLKVPELSQSSLAYLFDMMDELVNRAGSDAITRLPDIQSPMDVAALIWEKTSFYMALLEAPEAVHEICDKILNLLCQFFDEWFKRYGTEYVAHFPDYFMSGGITLSEDEVGVVDENMFREFFLPSLEHLSNRYGGIGIHCCADDKHQWDNYLDIPGLRVLNLAAPPTHDQKAYCEAAWEFFQGPIMQIHHGYKPEVNNIEDYATAYPDGTKVILELGAQTVDEAASKADRLNRVRYC